MNEQEARLLMQLFDAGYLVRIVDHPYVDTPVKGIYEEAGCFYYDSEVYTGRNLATVYTSGVRVYKPVPEWERLECF